MPARGRRTPTVRIAMLQPLKSSLIAGRQLGPLEDEVLRALWTRGDATVRELIDDSAVDGAYTTIMTTLDRLYKKGLLERTPEGRAFRYRPKQSEAELNQSLVAAGLKELLCFIPRARSAHLFPGRCDQPA